MFQKATAKFSLLLLLGVLIAPIDKAHAQSPSPTSQPGIITGGDPEPLGDPCVITGGDPEPSGDPCVITGGDGDPDVITGGDPEPSGDPHGLYLLLAMGIGTVVTVRLS